MKNVLITPDLRKANPYLTLLGDSLKNYGCNISYADFPKGLFHFNKLLKDQPETQIIHLHWISDLIMQTTWSKNKLLFWIKVILIFVDIVIIRTRGRKLIWTIHNKFAHLNFDNKQELIIRKLLFRLSDRVILHSKEAADEISKLYGINISPKISVIFHGNYEGCYPEPTAPKQQLRKEYNFEKDAQILLYFGSIRPYKGLETLIESFIKAGNPNLKLILAGGSPDGDYINKIIKKIGQNTDIVHNLKFIPDQELSNYLALSDIVIIPFANTLTSGSTILAMTFGKALILPEKARVFGCVPDRGVKYFSNSEDLIEIIKHTNSLPVEKMSKSNYDHAKSMSWKKVGMLTNQAYLS